MGNALTFCKYINSMSCQKMHKLCELPESIMGKTPSWVWTLALPLSVIPTSFL